MRSVLQNSVYPGIHSTLLLLAVLLMLPAIVSAECLEFKIVEFEDRVEAVCVGEQLTEAEKKANLEEEKRQEAEAQRQRAEEMRLLKDIAAMNKAKADAEAAEERKKRDVQPLVKPRQPKDRNMINLQKF